MKIFKIILLNILFLLVIFLCFDIYTYNNKIKMPLPDKPNWYDAYTKLPVKNFTERYKTYLSNPSAFPVFREDIIKPNSKSILFLGCSTVWGTFIDDVKQTFPGAISVLSGRTVYNRAMPGIGLAETIAILQMGLDDKVQNPEYVCYLYIADHIKRLYEPCFYFRDQFVIYKKENNKLVQQSDADIWYWHSYFLRAIYDNIIRRKSITETTSFLCEHFLLLNSEIKSKFPNAKFIIFVYNAEDTIKIIEKTLKQNNIQVVYLSELSNKDYTAKEYTQKDGAHPNEKAWQTIAPLFIKKLSL